MHLVASSVLNKNPYKQAVQLLVFTMVASCLMLTALVPKASAAPQTFYSISPSSGSVRPNNLISVTLSVKTDVAIAGASVGFAVSNGSFDSFESALSPSLSFVDYHPEQADFVYICNNNQCPPGTYQIAKIYIKAASSGKVQASFSPKETADPQLNLIEASGTSGNFTITSTAAPSPTKKSPNAVTVPQDSGTGGITPLQITEEQFAEQNKQAEKVVKLSSQSNEEAQGFWTMRNVVILSASVVIGIALIVLLIVVIRKLVTPKPPKWN